MAYGFEATTGTGGYLIDSTLTSTEYLAVKASGTVNAGGYVDRAAGEFIFAKPFDTSTASEKRVIFNTVTDNTKVYFKHKVYYVRLEKTQDATLTGTYGLQVKNASNVVVFDSRAAGSGMKIVSGIPKMTRKGFVQPGNGAGITQTLPVTSYSGVSTILHSGDPTNVYMSCTAAYYEFVTNYQVVFSGGYYDYANDRILMEAYFDLDVGSEGTNYFDNYSDLIFGELIT